MAGLAEFAEEYFSNLNPIASRIHSDILETKNAYESLWDTLNDTEKAEILDESIIKPEVALKYAFLDTLDLDLDAKGFNKNDILSYFDLQCGTKVIHDDTTKFRDEHSSPFSFHTKSQLDLCSFLEKKNPILKSKQLAVPETNALNSELAISHSKVLNELKSALKTNESKNVLNSKLNDTKKKSSDPSAIKKCDTALDASKIAENNFVCEFSLKPSKVVTEGTNGGSSGGFISKLMGNKKLKCGSAEEREQLVQSKPCQIVASSDNYFKTNFHAGSAVVRDSHPQNMDVSSKMPAYKSVSGMEESLALLSSSVASTSDGLAACSDSEFMSCEELSTHTETHELPKTGLDFLDNW